MQNFGLFRTAANQEKSFGNETVVTSDIRVVSWGWAVNGQEVLACPKLQYSIGIFYRILDAPEECARFLYERRGAALQTPPWPGSLPHASANVS